MTEIVPTGELYDFAFAKTAKVLGAERARRLIDPLLHKLGIELRTPQDLMLLSEEMSRLGGFEGAVGAMIGVAAVLRGATPSRGAS
jgi:hypothetical protein